MGAPAPRELRSYLDDSVLDVIRAHQGQHTAVHCGIVRRIADAPGRELVEEFVLPIQSATHGTCLLG